MGDVNPLELELSNAESEITGKLLETFRGTSASWEVIELGFSFGSLSLEILGMMMLEEQHS